MDLQELLSYVRKACDDYDMIAPGDKIAVAVSGGKDSLSCLLALHHMKIFYPKKYEIEAVTVSLNQSDSLYTPVKALCDKLSICYTIVKTNIENIVFDERKEKNPCSLCAKMRKGAFNDAAKNLGCNKIAMGHNKDDIIETFLMSLLYEGRIYTFAPVTFLDRKNLHVIRPLMYAEEREITSFTKRNNIPVIQSPCRIDGYTKREETKRLLKELSKSYENLHAKLFGAIKRSQINGWKKEIL